MSENTRAVGRRTENGMEWPVRCILVMHCQNECQITVEHFCNISASQIDLQIFICAALNAYLFVTYFAPIIMENFVIQEMRLCLQRMITLNC